MPVLRLNKLEAAERQLATAIDLFFKQGDPVSIHTLTCAAYDILHDIGRPRGLEPIFKGALFIPEKRREEYRDHLNRPRNFFKHADRDPLTRLRFESEVTVFLLFDACEFYGRLTGSRPPVMQDFIRYFHQRYPQFAPEPASET